MRLDAVALTPSLLSAPEEARAAEDAGYSGWFTAETGHDAMLLAALAVQSTSSIQVGTGIAVAFARNPMSLAYQANDIQQLSGGRFVLGLGSQIKAHITRRFSMPWSSPAARMREYVLALKAIWASWNEGVPLDFRGEFYSHTLMTPFFAPQPHEFGAPPVLVAAVGPRMTEVAGEVADGVLTHSFSTPEYLRNITVPALRRGAEAAGRDLADVTLGIGTFVVTGRTAEERAATRAAVAQQISFYGSTPAYRPVLDERGWGDLQTELNAMSKRGEWEQMADRIDDEVIAAFAIVTDDPDDVGHAMLERFGAVAPSVRVSLYPTWIPDTQALEAIQATLADA